MAHGIPNRSHRIKGLGNAIVPQVAFEIFKAIDLIIKWNSMKLTRVESREVYPVPGRPHYIIKLSKKTVDFYLEGKDMPDDKIGDVICRLVNALNAAEKQIEALFTVIQNAQIDHSEFSEYLDDYAEEEDYKRKYKLEDLKDALFHSMMKKDEKLIGKYINQIHVLESKSGEMPEVNQ